MKTFSDTLLSKFDNAIRQIGPVNRIIDKVVNRVAPTVEAKAGCSGYGCYVSYCMHDGTSHGCPSGQSWVVWAMSQQPQDCNNDNPNAGYCAGCNLYGYSC